MRTALKSNAEVFHFWANKVQFEGSSGNVFFRDSMIFSYGDHFCLARHMPDGSVAFTTRSYSSTTSAHLYHAKEATRHLPRIYVNDPAGSARENLENARRAIFNLLDKARRARTNTKRLDYLAQAEILAKGANAFLATFGEGYGLLPIDESNLPGIVQEMVAHQAALRLRAEELQRQRAEELQRQREAQAKARAIELAPEVEKWRGHTPTLHWISEAPAALRLSLDRKMVETSHGAEIPVEDALKLWPVIRRVMTGTKDYEPGTPIGSYRLTQIRYNGSIVVGCHDIAFEEIERIAADLGLLETA